MTIQEAINSGKRFRLNKDDGWIENYKTAETFRLRWIESNENCYFNSCELLSNQWEIEEETVEITYAQLTEVLKLFRIDGHAFSVYAEEIAAELGFKV